MFTPEEQPLLTGDDNAISEFVDCERCMVIDWRSSEEEAIDDAIRFLPEDALTYETTYAGTNTVVIWLRFRERTDSISLPAQPQNNFRVLLRVRRLLQPDYDIQLFRCTDDSDTPGFLLRPTEWWTAYRAAYSQQYQKIFRDLSDLNELWELERSSQPATPATGFSVFTLARRWDALQGWQRGILGTLIVLFALVVIVTVFGLIASRL